MRRRFAHRCSVRSYARKKDFLAEILARADTDLRLPAKKKRFQVVARNRMTCASGFHLAAREPQLMYGAKGRASSQRSIDYHDPPGSANPAPMPFIGGCKRFATGPDSIPSYPRTISWVLRRRFKAVRCTIRRLPQGETVGMRCAVQLFLHSSVDPTRIVKSAIVISAEERAHFQDEMACTVYPPRAVR